MANIEITQELVRQYFDYKDGVLYWKIKKPGIYVKNKGFAGGFDKSRNYYRVRINGKFYQRSHIVFLYHRGFLPKRIDHKDRVTVNDNIENLRESTISQNNKNRTSQKNSTSKYLGVCLRKDTSKWVAQIHLNGTTKRLGNFNTQEEAAIAYNEAAEIYHGEFANLNII